jgi:hypothetical protein
MFRIQDRAISPHKARYEAALKRLPAVHAEAQSHAISHLHSNVAAEAEEAGLDSVPFQIGWHKGVPHLGIEHSPAGDQLFDQEYGTSEEGPNPVLRQAITKHYPAANALYGQALRSRLGI